MSEITAEWLDDAIGNSGLTEWFKNQSVTEDVEVVKKLIAEDRAQWASWIIVRLMNYKQLCDYLFFVFNQVSYLPIDNPLVDIAIFLGNTVAEKKSILSVYTSAINAVNAINSARGGFKKETLIFILIYGLALIEKGRE